MAKQETWRESLALSAFHLLGLGLEIYKVHHGSWQYTAAGNWRIADVPLFSGFMYAAVASYLLQAWRRFDLKFGYWPRPAAAILLALAIYANFFLNRWMGDFRWIIGVVALAIFWRTYVDFYRHPAMAHALAAGVLPHRAVYLPRREFMHAHGVVFLSPSDRRVVAGRHR